MQPISSLEDCVLVLAQILLECVQAARLNDFHATLVKGFNGLVNRTPLLLIVLWQKSDETEKKVVGSSMYFANIRPQIASVSGAQAPTMIGTIFTEVLRTVPTLWRYFDV